MALIAAGSAACGTAQATTPQGKVENALTKLNNQKSLTLGLSFDATADQLFTAMKNEDGFTRADAEMLASLHLKLAVSSEKQFGLLKSNDTKGSSVGLQLANDKDGKESLFEARYVDQKLYLRADLKGLQKLDTSSDGADLNEFLANVDQLPSSLAAVKAAAKGEWIVIDPQAYLDYAKSMSDKFSDGSGDSADSPFSGLPGGTPSLDPKTQRQLVDALRTALEHNATYKSLGHHDGADHVQVSVPAQQLAKELKTSLTPVLQQVPEFKGADLNGLDDVPNRTVSVDVGVDGGRVTSVTVDLAQFDDQATGKLPLELTLDRNVDRLSAPKGALQLNPQDLLGLFTSSTNNSDLSG